MRHCTTPLQHRPHVRAVAPVLITPPPRRAKSIRSRRARLVYDTTFCGASDLPTSLATAARIVRQYRQRTSHTTTEGGTQRRFDALDSSISEEIAELKSAPTAHPRAEVDLAVTRAAKARDLACTVHSRAPTDRTRHLRKVAQSAFTAAQTLAENDFFVRKLQVTRRRRPDGTVVLDQGAVWKVSKELRGKAEWVPHTTKFIRNGAGSLATTPAEQVRNFCEFYTPVYNSVTPPRGWQQLAKFPPRDTDRTILPPQRFQVLKAIRSLRKTSSGRSGVPLDVWRTLVTDDEALGIITGLFVECWETNTVPDAWKVAHLIAIYKKHDPTLAKNYRLIFVEEHLSKAFQHLIKQHLDSHFETIAPEFSNGFRARRGCADALFILKQVLRKRKEHGLHSWLLLLDIQRAFDVVPRELLWACLLKCGVPPKLVQVLQGLYSDRTAEMSLEGYSQFMTADGGTCQGALLAPRLFSYFIYTIFEVWMHENPTSATELCYHEDPRSRSRAAAIKFFVSLFNVADDTAAIFDSRPALERHGLGLIKILQDFGLQVHLASAQSIAEGVAPKTAIMHIEPQGPARFDPVDHQPITVAPGFFIPVVDTYTYLG
jgi:hypothetical protein